MPEAARKAYMYGLLDSGISRLLPHFCRGEESTRMSSVKASRKSGVRASIGIHGEDVVELLFRVGGCTPDQLQEYMGFGYTITRRTLARLEAHGYLIITHDFARYKEKKALTGKEGSGRPPEYFYLTPKGQDLGGALAGAENSKEARAAYKRHGLPGLAAHSSLENRVLLAVLKAAAKDPRWSVPLSEIVCESGLDYPLQTGEKKGKGSQLRELYPDAEIPAVTSHGRCVHMLEVESELRTRRLVRKIEDYASWMRVVELVRPVLVVGLSPRQASSMRRAAMDGLAASTGEWRKWSELFSRKARGRDAAERVSPGHLVGFAALQDVEGMYSSRGVEAPVWQVMADVGGEPIGLSLSEMALLAGEARQMVYGVSEVS